MIHVAAIYFDLQSLWLMHIHIVMWVSQFLTFQNANLSIIRIFYSMSFRTNLESKGLRAEGARDKIKGFFTEVGILRISGCPGFFSMFSAALEMDLKFDEFSWLP